MMRIALCIGAAHDLRLLLLAVTICFVGSAATVQLFSRIRDTTGATRAGWIALTAVSLGTTIWSTHFVAMVAYRTGVPVVLDPTLTLLSLVIAIAASVPGLALAAMAGRRWCGVGGALTGLAVTAMHYTGMMAYRVDGIVRWDTNYVIVSVLLAIGLGAYAFDVFAGGSGRRRQILCTLALGGSVAGLHFTGMAAMTIVPLRLHGNGLDHLTMVVMAAATAFSSLLVIGCASVSALIDGHTKSDAYRRLRHMALQDSLTGLPNRTWFNETLDRVIDEGCGTTVVMLDLSRFKSVNDTFGHQAGDRLLIALAQRFTALLQPGECVARLGGDEFGAVAPFTDRIRLDDFLARLSAAINRPFLFDRFTAACGASIGVALGPKDGNDADTLLANADLAMYRAKGAHSSRPCFYQPEMDRAVRERRDLANDLRDAVGTDQFEIHYQVQASLETGGISGYEALLRWRNPHRGVVPPSVFIPLAEEIGEIVPLGTWVLDTVCREAAGWAEPHAVALNLSPLQLVDPMLVGNVARALEESGLPPARLELELTESAIIRDRVHALVQLRALKGLGVTLALDDFGVGYSSLDVLRSFPFDRIKLDSSFVADIEGNDQAVAILSSVAALGRRLGIPVLAEGIETAAQLMVVAREGCLDVQGYMIGRPARALADAVVVRRVMTLVTDAPRRLMLAS